MPRGAPKRETPMGVRAGEEARYTGERPPRRAMADEEERGEAAAAVVQAGAAAGAFAGAGMLAFVMIVTGWRGMGWLAPVHALAGVFFGAHAMDGGWGVSVVGLA